MPRKVYLVMVPDTTDDGFIAIEGVYDSIDEARQEVPDGGYILKFEGKERSVVT